MLSLRAWFHRVFGPDFSAARRLAPCFQKMAQMDIEERLQAADHPLKRFLRTLPCDQKPRGRFDHISGEWTMSDVEKIRAVKLYAKAGYPGMVR